MPDSNAPVSGGALRGTREFVTSLDPRCGVYYQYTNRLAHLYFLRSLNRIPGYLVFAYLLNDAGMQDPKTAEEWAGAIRLVHAQLGIDETRLAKAFGGAVIDVFIDVADIAAATPT